MIRSLLLLSVLSLFFACSKNNSSNGYGNNNNNNNSNPATSNSITIDNMAFNSSSIAVKAGTTVTWTNNESITHTVTADDASFDSGNMKQGDKFTHTFNTAGTFSYHCKYHSSMTGSVSVSQ